MTAESKSWKALEPTASPHRHRTLYMGLALFGLAALFVVLAYGLRPKTSTLLQGNPAPNFELTAFNGEFKDQHIALADLKGKVVVLNMWASWCKECEKEAAALEQGWRDYRERGVTFVGVDYLDTDTAGLAYLKRFGITYPNGPDIGSRIFQTYQSTGVPETFFIDQKGIVQFVQIGPLTQPQLVGLVDGLLAKGGS